MIVKTYGEAASAATCAPLTRPTGPMLALTVIPLVIVFGVGETPSLTTTVTVAESASATAALIVVLLAVTVVFAAETAVLPAA